MELLACQLHRMWMQKVEGHRWHVLLWQPTSSSYKLTNSKQKKFRSHLNFKCVRWKSHSAPHYILNPLFFFFFPSVVAQKLGEKKTTKKKNKPHTQTTKQKQPPPLKQNKTKKNHEPNKKPPKTKTQTQIHKRWSNSKTKSLISQGSEISSELHDAQEKFKTRHYSVDLTACHTKQFCLHPPAVTYLINKLQAFTGKAWGFSFLLYPDVIVSISPLCYSDLS